MTHALDRTNSLRARTSMRPPRSVGRRIRPRLLPIVPLLVALFSSAQAAAQSNEPAPTAPPAPAPTDPAAPVAPVALQEEVKPTPPAPDPNAPTANPSAPAANPPPQPGPVYAPYALQPATPSMFVPPPLPPETEMRSPALLGVGIGVATLGTALAITGGVLLGGGEETGWPGVFTLIPGGVLLAAGVPMIAVGASSEEVEPTPGSPTWRAMRGADGGDPPFTDETEMRAPGMTAVGTTLIAVGGISAIAISAKAIVETTGGVGTVASEVWGLNGASFAALAGGIAMTVHGARQDPVGVEVMRSEAAVDGGIVMMTAGAMLTSSMTFGLVADALGEHHANEPGVFWGTPVALVGGIVLMGGGLPLVIWGSGDPVEGDAPRAKETALPPEMRVGPSGFDVKWSF